MQRHALHAGKLAFPHPITNEFMEFHSPLPDDIIDFIESRKNK